MEQDETRHDSVARSKDPSTFTEEEWKQMLTSDEYFVLRQAGTEPAFVGEYTDTETTGKYVCKACGNDLFVSNTKFHSGCGWPSFYQPSTPESVIELVDQSHGMTRTEIRCKRCNSHLGHVFSGERFDTPTDLRYCINSIALRLIPTTDGENSTTS